MKGKYDDIIHHRHELSAIRKRMPMIARAAQFAPFSALEGHDDAIVETGRYVDKRIQLSSEEESVIFSRLTQIATYFSEERVTVKYFQPDKKKEGGVCLSTTGKIVKIDELDKFILMDAGQKISFEDILEIEADCFD